MSNPFLEADCDRPLLYGLISLKRTKFLKNQSDNFEFDCQFQIIGIKVCPIENNTNLN